jgi:O-acetyl-ADP-ribose deacetylase (regulator of RNase III)
MRIIKGDLISLALTGTFNLIVHGCNCFNTMGAGFANQIRINFPEAWSADQRTVRGDMNKLGSFTQATVNRNGHDITIINAYTQFGYGKRLQTNYSAIETAFAAVGVMFPHKRIGYPRIGGGDWNIISKIIDEQLNGLNHTLVEHRA